MNYCINCGSQVSGRFCQNCGTDCDPQQGEKVEEIVKNLYTLRAGISVISVEYDRAKEKDLALENQYDRRDVEEMKREISDMQWQVEKSYNYLDKNKLTKKAAIKKAKKIESWATFFERVGKLFWICSGAILTTLIVFIFTTIGGAYKPTASLVWTLILVMIALFPLGWLANFTIPIALYENRCRAIKVMDEDERELSEKKKILNSIVTHNASIDAKRSENAVNSEKIGSAMFDSLKQQFGSFLSPADWENIDLLIFYFESGRALNLREALQLVDRQRQTDSILEAINEATKKICYTIERGFLQIETTLIGCASVLSSQLQSIQLQQQNLAISVDSMRNALQSKANTSSNRLMEDVHQLRIYADNYEVKKRNS